MTRPQETPASACQPAVNNRPVPSDYAHRRYNALTGEHVLVSPHRARRPWQGRREPPAIGTGPAYDPDCPLCPGNRRTGGARTPVYTGTHVFTDEASALLPNAALSDHNHDPLGRAEPVQGTCRVLCFSPRHDWTLAEMPSEAVRGVVESWITQTAELSKCYRWVQVFENKGELMGCGNSHPHGQIWAGNFIPSEPAKEDRQQLTYLRERGSVLLLDYLQWEEQNGQERVILQNDHWTALVPYWARWAFEILLVPRRHMLRLPDLLGPEKAALVEMLNGLLTRYDNLFEVPFPYTMGWHGAPGAAGEWGHWQLHAHFYPPLLRSAAIRQFMVGYEMLAESLRDLTAEQAAQALRRQPAIHFRQRRTQ